MDDYNIVRTGKVGIDIVEAIFVVNIEILERYQVLNIEDTLEARDPNDKSWHSVHVLDIGHNGHDDHSLMANDLFDRGYANSFCDLEAGDDIVASGVKVKSGMLNQPQNLVLVAS